MIAAMTATYSLCSSYTTDIIVGPPPDAIFYDELVFMLTHYKEIMEDTEPLYHRGLPHALFFMPRTYGGSQGAEPKVGQWSNICDEGAESLPKVRISDLLLSQRSAMMRFVNFVVPKFLLSLGGSAAATAWWGSATGMFGWMETM